MDFNYIATLMPTMLAGLRESLKIFCLTLAFALPLGLPLALGLISRSKIVRFVTNIYVWLFRGTPLMLQILFFWVAIPLATGLKPDRFTTAVITFVLNYAAYFAEIYRAGIQSVDRGQLEASKSLAFSPWQSMKFIVLPQAFRRVVPPISNEVITLVKDTALAFIIGVPELMKAAKGAVNRDNNLIAYGVAAAFYLILTLILTIISQQLEKQFSKHERKDAV